MRFKGVVTKKGTARGDVIEYSPDEKVRVALGVAITAEAQFSDLLVHPAKIEVKNLHFTAKGDPLKRLWQNNSYEATGRIDVARRDKAKDRILRPATYDFTIKVEDCLCSNGLPDLKTTELKLVAI
jgi:hypothetical protein